jgi:eukaryotic-like serine/threonine-protein kinase
VILAVSGVPSQAVSDLLIGTEVDNGEYRIIERIGVGGMGSVYKAEQPSMNRLVAIKVLHPRFAAREDLVSRFRREARAMSQLSHPNTARVYKFGQLQDGAAYFVMDYMEGKNLAHTVRSEGPMDPERALNVMIQVCGALDEAHRAGIIHRDLKPENIFLTQQGGTSDFPKVLDFGLAKVSEKQMGRGSMMLTQQGMVFGTPEFMSPEQTQGEKLDRRSDIYSLGLILYELLTGKLPFDAEKPIDVMRAHVQEPAIPLNQRLPGKRFSSELEAVIAKALQKKPADRYETAVDLAQALRGCLRDSLGSTAARRALPSNPAPAPASSGAARSTKPTAEVDPPVVPVSRGPLIAIGAGLAVVLIAVGVWLGAMMR